MGNPLKDGHNDAARPAGRLTLEQLILPGLDRMTLPDRAVKPLHKMGQFATVVIDPPWPASQSTLQKNGRDAYKPWTYSRMLLADIRALPIPEILAEDAWVFMWTTNRFLLEALECLSHWGLRYRALHVWDKGAGVQMPGLPAFSAEFALCASRGKPRFLETKAFKTCNQWPRQGNSAKPEGFYELLRRVCPAPRIDVFSRRAIEGFERWGNQAPP